MREASLPFSKPAVLFFRKEGRYAREKRDALILFARKRGWTLERANELLFDHGFAALGVPPE